MCSVFRFLLLFCFQVSPLIHPLSKYFDQDYRHSLKNDYLLFTSRQSRILRICLQQVSRISGKGNYYDGKPVVMDWFIQNKIFDRSSSFMSLEHVIRLRAKEIATLQVHPTALISIFNKALL